ncbi:DUF1566 domain-containing protein [Pelomonas sp. SE-A7]|uniref:Lcl domain-containing protein n=1 Tax=Pelomonas sp. SE-A7 TaxID=3054953 RepID=UPI00259CFEA7|nr:DUF1566 domain-containing protein [Pelomonas sp. SE-A7]MDM4765536.1 DUF1566 domain-containing protein [Pelomonas sp. SE-A7]
MKQRHPHPISALLLGGLALSASLLMLSACGGGGGGGGASGASSIQAGGNSNNSGPPTNTITGTVSFNGQPLSGVTITAWNTNTNKVFQVTTTDASGNYRIVDLPTGWNATPNYQLWASKDGYGFSAQLSASSDVASVTRSDYTGQYSGVWSGIYKTVVNFDSLANKSVTGANFTAYDGGSRGLVSLSATGQKRSYAAGDDGDRASGIAAPAQRFVDLGDGTVNDKLTGLIWLKNAGCLKPSLWESALQQVGQLAHGSCGLSDNSTAGQWRVPNLVELESLIDVAQHSPALPNAHPFVQVSNGLYWTSTSYFGGQGGSPNAWAVRLDDGRYVNDSVSNLKASSLNGVWAVKNGIGNGLIKLQASGAYVSFTKGDDGGLHLGVPLTYQRWIDKGDGTLLDTVTGLTWLKMADCIHKPWVEAVAAVNVLASGQCGLSDGSKAGAWRMPNRKELQSLADRAMNNHSDFFNSNYVNTVGVGSQAPVFGRFITSEYYWTSSTLAADPALVWTVYSCDYGTYEMPKTAPGYTLAVR